ncbi:hypothetical protein [Boudabousia marimammalium]|uniref:Uncharacterized protein n=1 Tax=Boudabousia marimammalium TaxID=156892 RepID=A0A1Q5PSS6_9ACTO|nr:hypothetical protein [Boudabousia marimammalium]OKL50502.1 hypothetical protein BM477_00570 [Boudabousia marimammalium]
MFKLAAAYIRGNIKRCLAMLLSLTLTVPIFVALSANLGTQQLKTIQTLNQNWRGAYDILVRPPNSALPLEAEKNIVRPSFLSNTYGGITLPQLDTIRSLTQVEVAAPIAIIGQIYPTLFPYSDVSALTSTDQPTLLNVKTNTLSRNGRYQKTTDSFVFLSPDRLCFDPELASYTNCTEKKPLNHIPTQNEPPVFSYGHTTDPEETKHLTTGTANLPPAQNIVPIGLNYLPLTWAAIDPVAEAQLIGLDKSISRGQYLTAKSGIQTLPYETLSPELPTSTQRILPAILTARMPAVDLKYHLEVKQLEPQLAQLWKHEGASETLVTKLSSAPQNTLIEKDIPLNYLWQQFQNQFSFSPQNLHHNDDKIALTQLDRIGDVTYRAKSENHL